MLLGRSARPPRHSAHPPGSLSCQSLLMYLPSHLNPAAPTLAMGYQFRSRPQSFRPPHTSSSRSRSWQLRSRQLPRSSWIGARVNASSRSRSHSSNNHSINNRLNRPLWQLTWGFRPRIRRLSRRLPVRKLRLPRDHDNANSVRAP